MKALLMILLVTVVAVSGQSSKMGKYGFNATKDPSFPYGYYIPENLEDAYRELEKAMSPEYLEEFKDSDLEKLLDTEQVRLGLWMREYWGLHSGSRLRLFFNDKGIFNPDNMTGAIIEGFWNYLNGNDNDLEKWVVRDLELQQNYDRWRKNKPSGQTTEKRKPDQIADTTKSTVKTPAPKKDSVETKSEEHIPPTAPIVPEDDPLRYREPGFPGGNARDSLENDPLRYREP